MNQQWMLFNKVFSRSERYILATITSTEGSTYQKAGAMLLANENECFGLLSGGCLEDDIRLRGLSCLETNEQALIHYDLTGDSEITWGLGLGCEGKIDILLQPLTPENEHLGFADLLEFVNQRQHGYLSQSLDSTESSPLSILSSNEISKVHFLPEQQQALNKGRGVICSDADGNRRLLSVIRPPINVLICGAGPDVVPVTTMARELGWRLELWDHRKAYLEQPAFVSIENKRKIRSSQATPEEMADFDAVIIMTHHLEHDEHYLNTALQSPASYIGLLGPASRRDKLFNRLNMKYSDHCNRVYGPVGLDIGANTPSSIALSILSQIQHHIFARADFKNERSQAVV